MLLFGLCRRCQGGHWTALCRSVQGGLRNCSELRAAVRQSSDCNFRGGSAEPIISSIDSALHIGSSWKSHSTNRQKAVWLSRNRRKLTGQPMVCRSPHQDRCLSVLQTIDCYCTQYALTFVQTPLFHRYTCATPFWHLWLFQVYLCMSGGLKSFNLSQRCC